MKFFSKQFFIQWRSNVKWNYFQANHLWKNYFVVVKAKIGRQSAVHNETNGVRHTDK